MLVFATVSFIKNIMRYLCLLLHLHFFLNTWLIHSAVSPFHFLCFQTINFVAIGTVVVEI